jgi:hypothetical protein
MNGIHSSWVEIKALYADPVYGRPMMVIKKWCFIGAVGCPPGSPHYPDQSPWIYKFTLNPSGDYMFPAPAGGFADLTNLQELAGQGGVGTNTTSPPFTPVEKVFDFHFIVQVPVVDGVPLSGNQYFDASYGVTYPSAAGFEAQAVAGYACQFPPDAPVRGEHHVFTPIPGSPDISFTVRPEFSM